MWQSTTIDERMNPMAPMPMLLPTSFNSSSSAATVAADHYGYGPGYYARPGVYVSRPGVYVSQPAARVVVRPGYVAPAPNYHGARPVGRGWRGHR